jgi:DNA-binding NtrC family response regulator
VAEHGSGKAAAAARIHTLSSRAAGPFQVFQGREASEEILTARDGQGGTVYLQEVGDLTGAAQKELVRQIGLNGDGEAQRRVPRFICGTSRELEPEVKAGKFREDLYYGVSGRKIFPFFATGFSPPPPAIFAGPCPCSVPRLRTSFWNTAGRETFAN